MKLLVSILKPGYEIKPGLHRNRFYTIGSLCKTLRAVKLVGI
jgi:hypothetical protein